MSNPFDAAVMVLLNGQSDSQPSEPVDGDRLLHHISSFIARYLQCSEHQRTVLALWVLHTYCYRDAQVSPYLSIQSAQKQSGKTLCLQLLQLLCEFPTLTAGFTASSLLRLMGGATDTLLLDECHSSLGTRARPKSPTLRAILIRGTHSDPNHLTITRDRRTFCPKAFAGKGRLPEDLADHSIPIILQPLEKNTALFATTAGIAKDHEAIDNVETILPSSDRPITEPVLEMSLRSRTNLPMIEHLHIRYAAEEAKPLRRQLRDWHTLHRAALQEMSPCTNDQFPPDLSCRQQDLCEPLLHLAELIGGDWPVRIREALSAVFEEQTKFDLQANIQLLADIRDCFAYYSFPKRLSTSNLLDWIHSLPARPWDMDGRFSAHTLARLLVPFNIHPRMQRINNGNDKGDGKGSSGLRGYQLQDFKDPWKKHLDLHALPSAIANEKAEIANKTCPRGELASRRDRACCGVALVQAHAEVPWSPTHAGVACGGVEVPSPTSAAPAKNEHAMDTDRPLSSAVADSFQDQSISSTPSTQSTSSAVTQLPEPNLAGFYRLTHLHQRLRLQGLCPPLDNLANMYPHESLQAALDWVDAHPQWSAQFKYKPAMEFIAAFQNGPVRLYLHD